MVSRIKMQCAISFLFPISLQFGQQIEVNWVQSESADQQKVFDATQAHFEWTIDPFSVWGEVASYVTSRQLINQAFKTTGLLSDALKFETQLTGTDRWPISIKLNLCNKKANSKHFFLPISRVDFDQQSIQKSNSSPHCEFVAFWIKTILQPANRSSGLIINWQSNERFCVPVARIKILIIAPSGEPSVHNKSP